MYVEKCMENKSLHIIAGSWSIRYGTQDNNTIMTSLLKHSFLKTANDILGPAETCNEALMIDYEDKIKCMV